MTRIRVARFFVLFVLPNIAFGFLALVMPAAWLIALLSGAMAALSIGVCIAYFPVMFDMLTERHRRIDRADLLALGIFCAWFAIVLRTIWGLAWRYYGHPVSWVDTQLTGYFIFLGVCGAGFHLVAPGAIESRVPTREWIKVGALTSLGVMSIFVGSWLLGVLPFSTD